MTHKLTLWLFKLIAPFDRSLSDKPAGYYSHYRKAQRPDCNLPYGRCIYQCKLICPRGRP